MPDNVEVPVLIVGGGGSGLSASVFLSDLGVESLLIERHPSTSQHPKAHILNGRTMEIFAKHGVAGDVYRDGTPAEKAGRMAWLTSLGGDRSIDRRTLWHTHAYGGSAEAERYARACPYPHSNLAQRWLEPLLLEHARRRRANAARLHHKLVDVDQSSDEVVAMVLDSDAGETYEARCQYLIGADGGKTVGSHIGVTMEGTPTLMHWINVHARTDFSELLPFDDTVVNRIAMLSEDGRLEGCGVVAMGPKRWGRHAEEWQLTITLPPADDRIETLDDDAAVREIRRLMRLPDDHHLEVLRVSRWAVEGTVADRFQAGRVFLVGDAAHRHPPSGGMGLNIGIQDAHNLTWKLAAVLRGSAPPGCSRATRRSGGRWRRRSSSARCTRRSTSLLRWPGRASSPARPTNGTTRSWRRCSPTRRRVRRGAPC